MHETNTAADRLLRIITEVANSPDQGLVKVWARVLRLESDNKLDVFRGILSVAALANEVESVVCRHNGPATKLYQRSLDKVRHALMANIDGHKHTLNAILKPEVVNDLEHCAAMYKTIDPEIPVAKEDVNAIKESVQELFDEVSASKLPSDLRIKILDLLEVIRQQISQFEIRGVTALHECLRQSLARLTEIYPAIQEHRNEPIFKKLANVIANIGAICENAQKALPILKVASKLLPFLSPGCEHNALPEPVDVEVISDH